VREVVWLVGFLIAAYTVARLIVFLKEKTEKKGEGWVAAEKRREEREDKETAAAVIAGITAYEEDLGAGRAGGKRAVRGRREVEVSWWRVSGRTG
jgi:hypothetical protein